MYYYYFYVDDLNIIGTHKEILEILMYLKNEFEMKDLEKIKYCIDLQIEYLQSRILLHQLNYTEKVLKRFSMDKANPLSTSMVIRSLNAKKDSFRPHEYNEEDFCPEVLYLSVIRALIYLANYTRSDIAFATNLLATFSSSPMRYWNGINMYFIIFEEQLNLVCFIPQDQNKK